MHYRVNSVENLLVILNHFDKYPLITQKCADLQLFKQVVMLIRNKEQLTMEGLQKILAIKASINHGLSDELKVAFKDITPVQRPKILDSKIKDPNWLAGFAGFFFFFCFKSTTNHEQKKTKKLGEGCFFVSIVNSSTTKLGKTIQLIFQITQHNKDELLLRNFTEFFNSGNVFKNGHSYVFKVTKFSVLDEKIVPLFKDCPILGTKSKDFHDWLQVFFFFVLFNEK